MRYAIRLAVLFFSAFASLGIASAENRVALVIGNADYKIGRLANPANDADAVAEALEKQLKFDRVLLRKNLDAQGFRVALRELARVARGAEIGLVFFAGHGIEVNGRNFLIPTDAALASARDVGLEAIALDDVQQQLDGVTKLKLVVLDACRINPFPAAGRSPKRGLNRIEPEAGTLVAYAAKNGTAAEDGTGRHSPFTVALLKRIITPGLDVRLMFGYVSEDVKAATNLAQVPYLYGQLGGEQVHLVSAVAADAKPVVLPPSAATEAARICREVEGMSNPAMLAVLEEQYKGTPAGACVAARLAQLNTVTVVTPPPIPPPKVVEPSVTMAPDAGLGIGALGPLGRPETNAEDEAVFKRWEEFRKHAMEPPQAQPEMPALKPGRVFRDCMDVCPEMVVVPAGEFIMGSPPYEAGHVSHYESPQRKVTIARPFAVGKYELTFAEWDACAADSGCRHQPSDNGWGKGRRPVISVSWHDAKEYVAWLSRRTGKSYRLLSEAEWEYAARAGTTTRYAIGDTISKSQAQFQAGQTVEVGSFPANKFGLHDIHGNVWEWVEDAWHLNYEGSPPADGSVRQGGDLSLRVMRGGSWDYYPDHLRSAARFRSQPGSRLNSIGFRVARTL